MSSSPLWGTLITRILLSREVSTTMQKAKVLSNDEANRHATTVYLSVAQRYKVALASGQTMHAKVLAAAYADAKAQLLELIKQYSHNSQKTKESQS